uniref:Secreted protein n=1 Tax=Mesocestoides corti TaxID=53468 RepID=A0A5K3F0Q3_MESCO
MNIAKSCLLCCCDSCLRTVLNPVAPPLTQGSPFRSADPQLPPHSDEYLSWIILTPRSRC